MKELSSMSMALSMVFTMLPVSAMAEEAHTTIDTNGGGGSGESSSDSSSPVIVTPPEPDKPNFPTQGEIKGFGTVNTKGNITGKPLANAFDQYGVKVDAPKNLKYTPYTMLWLIARKLGCTISELERLNNKSRFDLIHPNDVLRVPEK